MLKPLEHIKTVIFDWDGTLHDSFHIYKPAFLKSMSFLVKEGYIEHANYEDDIIKTYLGLNPKDMWASFTPKLPDHIKEEASAIISKSMTQSILNHEARLYEGALDTLKYLKDKGYHLVYLSNSKTYYMNLMDEVFDLCRYFDLMIASEMYQFMPKKMILERIKSTLQKPAIMIGDRFLDIETGMYNKFDTIGCLYGYGKQYELKDATYLISNIKDLEKLL